MYNYPHNQASGPVINRFADVMAHTKRYAFKGVTRLAEEAHVSASSVSRLLNGKINPSFALVQLLTNALEQDLGFRIDPRELISIQGGFLTPHVCEVVRCRGCLPKNALDEFGSLKLAFQGVLPGTWVTSRYPNGYQPLEDKEVK